MPKPVHTAPPATWTHHQEYDAKAASKPAAFNLPVSSVSNATSTDSIHKAATLTHTPSRVSSGITDSSAVQDRSKFEASERLALRFAVAEYRASKAPTSAESGGPERNSHDCFDATPDEQQEAIDFQKALLEDCRNASDASLPDFDGSEDFDFQRAIWNSLEDTREASIDSSDAPGTRDVASGPVTDGPANAGAVPEAEVLSHFNEMGLLAPDTPSANNNPEFYKLLSGAYPELSSDQLDQVASFLHHKMARYRDIACGQGSHDAVTSAPSEAEIDSKSASHASPANAAAAFRTENLALATPDQVRHALEERGLTALDTPSKGNNCGIYALLKQVGPNLSRDELDRRAMHIRSVLMERRPDVKMGEMLHLDNDKNGVGRDLLKILHDHYGVNGALTLFQPGTHGVVEIKIGGAPYPERHTTPLRVLWTPESGGHFSAVVEPGQHS